MRGEGPKDLRQLLSGAPAEVVEEEEGLPSPKERDYKRVLEATRRARASGEDVDTAVMAAARG